LKPRVQIENWAFTKTRGFQLNTEQRFGSYLAGRATKHPRLGDADIFTSRIIDVTVNGEALEVETSNTVYILGAISPEYAEFLAGTTPQA
jgi:hypothetical protein